MTTSRLIGEVNAINIITHIAQHAVKTPNATAIQAIGRRPLSYARLQDHIRYVVSRLRRAGIGSADRVAIVLPRGPEAATAFLTITAGAVAAPLNPENKQNEYESLLSRINPALLLTGAGPVGPARAAARALQIPVAELSTSQEAGLFDLVMDTGSAAAKQAGPVRSEDVALLLPTSGTTSRPKIVPLTHHNIAASARNIAATLELGPEDCCLSVVPFFHVGGLVDVIATSLFAGGSIVCTSGSSVPEFYRSLDEFRPTWAQASPAMLQEVLNDAGSYRHNVANSSLRVMRSVSAPISARLKEDFERVFRLPVLDIYGLTETTGLIACDSLRGRRRAGSVGQSAGPEVGILDDEGALLPANHPGEIAVRGETVMLGYEDAPDENARQFAGSWFRTGDLGYLDSENYVYLTGRIKELINRGGEKISPCEVDEVLLDHPAVAECATFALDHETFGEDVAAAVVPAKGTEVGRHELIAYLSERLAYFKVPRVLHFVDEIPRTPTGKPQRSRLSEALALQAGTAPPNRRPSYAAPETSIAEALTQMWSRALKQERIGIYDNFFDLGGDSLKAAHFINELQQTWGEIVYVSAVFDAPTIAEFEDFLRRYYPEMSSRMLGRYLVPRDIASGGRVDPDEVTQLQRAIVLHTDPGKAPLRRNPRAIFILSPPRSGSTLLRVMLQGHSRLFSPPELMLLSFKDLAQRKAWFSGSQKFLLEGNIRAVMQLKNLDPEEAQQLVRSLEDQNLPIEDYYRRIQEWAGDRTLVDKTPYYAARVETLQRAEQMFEEPVYIHLMRHPYGMIRSFEEAKMDQLWYPRLLGADVAGGASCPYELRKFGEMIWLILNQNILRFLEGVPRQRQHRLRFEDLVGDPRRSMTDVCRFLNLELEPEMLAPHSNSNDRMTDGLYPVSRMIGDMKFHRHKKISSETGDLWKQAYEIDFLSNQTRRLAEELGFQQTVADVKGRREFAI